MRHLVFIGMWRNLLEHARSQVGAPTRVFKRALSFRQVFPSEVLVARSAIESGASAQNAQRQSLFCI